MGIATLCPSTVSHDGRRPNGSTGQASPAPCRRPALPRTHPGNGAKQTLSTGVPDSLVVGTGFSPNSRGVAARRVPRSTVSPMRLATWSTAARTAAKTHLADLHLDITVLPERRQVAASTSTGSCRFTCGPFGRISRRTRRYTRHWLGHGGQRGSMAATFRSRPARRRRHPELADCLELDPRRQATSRAIDYPIEDPHVRRQIERQPRSQYRSAELDDLLPAAGRPSEDYR